MKDLKLIKNYYGEDMMHFARDNFSTLLEHKGKLFSILSSRFAYSKSLLNDLKEQNLINVFKDIICCELYKDIEFVKSNLKPQELLGEAGYYLYECKTEEEINFFKKYYAPGELLCTFGSNRLNSNYVFFAVKKDVDKIKREDFKKPDRQDLYGTSVISIQFTKRGHYLSIKNRYNHNVNNDNATFSNNLDNIIPGLTDSFEKEYNLSIISNMPDTNFVFLNYTMDDQGKYYKYNYEINKIFYCPDGTIIDNGKVVDTYAKEKERYIVIDYFIVDLKDKKIFLYDNNIKESIMSEFKDLQDIKIIYGKDKKNKVLVVTKASGKRIYIEIDKDNKIIGFKDDDIKIVNDNCFKNNIYMEYLDLGEAIYIGDNCLKDNRKLQTIWARKATRIGDNCMYSNESLTKAYLENVNIIGDNVLFSNQALEEINLDNVKVIGDNLLFYDNKLLTVNMKNLKIAGNCDFKYCKNVQILDFPKLEYTGESYFEKCENAVEGHFENLIVAGDYFLSGVLGIKYIDMPKLKKVGCNFMCEDRLIESLYTPELKEIGPNFLRDTRNLYNNYYCPYFLIENGMIIKQANIAAQKVNRLNFMFR